MGPAGAQAQKQLASCPSICHLVIIVCEILVTGYGSWRQNFFARVARCAARLLSREVSGNSQPYQSIIGDRQVGVN